MHNVKPVGHYENTSKLHFQSNFDVFFVDNVIQTSRFFFVVKKKLTSMSKVANEFCRPLVLIETPEFVNNFVLTNK